MALSIRPRFCQPIVSVSSIDVEVSLQDVDGRSLDEQVERILPCISNDNLVKELRKRKMSLLVLDTKEEKEIKELKDALRGIVDEIEFLL